MYFESKHLLFGSGDGNSRKDGKFLLYKGMAKNGLQGVSVKRLAYQLIKLSP